MSAKNFEYQGRSYKLFSRVRNERERGYVGRFQNHYNILQRRYGLFWFTVEEERIPAHAWISAATLGYSGWDSPLCNKCQEMGCQF